MVEVGVAKGELAAYVLKAFPQVEYYMVDPWAPCEGYNEQRDFDAEFKVAMGATEFAAGRRHVLRMIALEAARLDIEADLVFIDADHQYAAVRDDLWAWWPHVVSSGILSGHDYHGRHFSGVVRAVGEFADMNRLQVNRAGRLTWWIVKA